MDITRLDHLVLTVRDIDATIAFYTHVLGMQVETFADNRKSLHFNGQKINLHQAGNEFEPKAAQPAPGSADLCFIASTPIDDIITHMQSNNIIIEVGPVERNGATCKLISIYVRDPDGNLIEIANYL